MASSNGDVNVVITGDATGGIVAMKQMSSAVNTHVGEMKAGLAQLNSSLSGLGRLSAGAFLGGQLISSMNEAINFTLEYTRSNVGLGRQLGMTANEAAAVNDALEDVGSSTEQYSAGANALSRMLKRNEDGLNAVGLKTRDAGGGYRSLNDMMRDAINITNTYKDGTDKAVVMQTLFGRGAAGMTGVLKLTDKAVQESTDSLREMGLVISQDDVEAAKENRKAMEDVKDVFDGVKKAIGDALIPVLTQLANWFREIGPNVVAGFRAAIQVLVSMFWGLATSISIVIATIKLMVKAVLDTFMGLGTAVGFALKGEFTQAGESLKGVWDDWGRDGGDWVNDVVEAAAKGNEKIQKLFAEKSPVAKQEGAGTGGAGDGEDGKGAGKLGRWKLQLAEQKNAGDDFRREDIQADITYWNAKLSTISAKTKEGKALRMAIEAEILALTAAARDKQKKIEQQTVESQKAADLAQLEDRSEMTRKLAAMGQISADEAIDREREVEDKRGAIEMAALQKRRDQVKANAVERMKVDDLIAAEHARHNAKINALDIEAARLSVQIATQSAQTRAALEMEGLSAREDSISAYAAMGALTRSEELAAYRKLEDDRWEVTQNGYADRLALAGEDKVVRKAIFDELLVAEQQHHNATKKLDMMALADKTRVFKSMQSGFQSVIADFLKGSKTIGETLRGMMAAVLGAIINMLAELAAEWLVASLMRMAGVKAEGGSNIAARAAEAGAGGVASMAAAPWPLNMGAVGFGAAMYGAAMMYAPLLAASGGFDIPAGMNPVTQLHQKEMVLPAHIAEPLRDSIAGGGGMGGGSTSVTLNFSGLDGPSTAAWLRNGGARQITEAMKRRI